MTTFAPFCGSSSVLLLRGRPPDGAMSQVPIIHDLIFPVNRDAGARTERVGPLTSRLPRDPS
jgi:hypothetical protein